MLASAHRGKGGERGGKGGEKGGLTLLNLMGMDIII